jgi:UPF0716 protein FxsA
MWLFVIFVVVPIIEIALFIEVGGFLGLWPTLAIVVLTALAGSALLRAQGFATLETLQNNLRTGGDPINPMAHGALILVAGVLLLTPGFFTDTVGLSLMIPRVRIWVIKWVASRIKDGSIKVYSNTNAAPRRPRDDSTLDGDYTVIDDDPEEKGDSGWTKR